MRFLLYLLRWQMSTPVLYICLWWLADVNGWLATFTANLIGGTIFYFVDRAIFRRRWR